MKISLSSARDLALHAQGLDGRWKLPRGKEGAAQAIERLGYVQIDTIAARLRAFAAFNGCGRAAVEEADPTRVKGTVARMLEEPP